nr:nuclear transport factor 2 family protein [Sphingomonas sp. CDS-1]
MTDDQTRLLRELQDRQEIQHLLTRYARAIDRLDIDLLKSLYHPDARDDHASFKGTAQEFAEHAIAFLRDAFVTTMHHVTHSHISVNGDEAAAESYYYAYHRMEGDHAKVAGFFGTTYADQCSANGTLDDGHEFICGGRYVDRLSRRNGEWRISRREITVEWKHFRPATHGDPDSGIEAIAAPARRDRDDIAYRFFAEVGAPA